MTTAATVLPPAVVKEIRALFPTYAAALAVIVVGCFSQTHTFVAAALLAFAFGSVALGAQSFGHEYSHRTLGLLLSQPLDRRRVFLHKFAVLFAMLLTLTTVTLLVFHDTLRRAASPHTEPSMFLLAAAACGLFVAPWLTLVSRSTLAAVIFTIGIPGLLAVASDLAGAAIYGLENAAAIDRFKLEVFWRAMVVICSIGAVASWRMFMRLEVNEGHSAAVDFPESLGGRSATAAATPSRPRHRVWMLLTKELRLQQMAFVVAVLFAVIWLSVTALERSVADAPRLPLNGLAMLYGGVLAMLIGAMASAEERQLGTAEWQILLPMPAWQQWAVKAGVTLGLALVLGAVLPAALRYLSPAGDDIHEAARAWRETAAMVVILASASLYVSSLCTNGVRALVLAIPAIVAASLFVVAVGDAIGRVVFRLVYSPGGRPLSRGADIMLVVWAIGAGLVVLLLWLAFRNHRWTDRNAGRLSRQAVAITGYITAGLAVLILLGLR